MNFRNERYITNLSYQLNQTNCLIPLTNEKFCTNIDACNKFIVLYPNKNQWKSI